MKLLFIFVTLLLISCFITTFQKALCEGVLLSPEIGNSHFQTGRFIFMGYSTKKEIECEGCGKKFKIYPSQIKKGTKYCSHKCYTNNNRGQNNPAWNGSLSKYVSIHQYMTSTYGKPTQCEDCGRIDVEIQWASINHTYTRNRDDWMQLCCRCHYIFDGRSRVIYQLNDFGEIQKEYSSVVVAAEQIRALETGIRSAAISRTRYLGSYWQYEDKYGKEYVGHRRFYYSVDDNLKIVKRYMSLVEAAMDVGCYAANLSTAIKLKTKIKGFYWIKDLKHET